MNLSSQDQFLARRRQQLYGPGRCAGLQAIQSLQRQDHIKQSFRRGVNPAPSREAYQSITARDYKGHDGVAKPLPPPWQTASQYETHLQLGSDHSVPMTTLVRSDFTAKPTVQCKPRVPEGINEINIADLAPRYMANKAFGRSLYNRDFDGNKSHAEWTARMVREGRKVGRRQKTTGYQKATHFELGSDDQCLVSETSRCFTARGPRGHQPAGQSSSSTDVDRSKSNVFRAGDYNASSLTPKDHYVSIQKKDFVVNPDSLPPAGISTATGKGYSHVIPKHSSGKSRPAITSLRKLLVDKNISEFQSPCDPSSINVTKAFLKYDQDRSGKISVEELKRVCSSLGTPITQQEITELLKECDLNGDGQLDYAEFTKYLSVHGVAEGESDEPGHPLVSTNTATYSNRTKTLERADETESEFVGSNYQTSTHFHFGDEKGFSSSSVYTKDFDGGSVRGVKKPLPPPPPGPSKVMHEFPVVYGCDGETTARRDYIRHNVAALERGRLEAMRTNKEMHKEADWSSGHTQDKAHYRESVMTSSYISPGKGHGRPPSVNPAPKDYHHLESDRALLPSATKARTSCSRSEAADQYVTPIEDPAECVAKRRETLRERTDRISNNKESHIHLGFDRPKQISENASEYGEKSPLDPMLPAAGVKSLPGKGYSIIGHDSGEGWKASLPEEGVGAGGEGASGLQTLLQQRNFLRNINPRDPLNINIRKAFLEYDKDLSGTVSKEEVMAVCNKMNIAVSEEDLKEIMSKCSKSGEDQIDYHEFALHLTRQQPPDAAAAASSSSPGPGPGPGPGPTADHHHHHLASITMRDFKPPQQQRMSAMQKMVLEQDAKRHVPVVPTHFYHVDPKEELCSTTRRDFIRPEEVC